MADDRVSEAPAGPGRTAAASGLAIAVRVGILYLTARLVTTVFLMIAAALSAEGSRFGPDASVGSLSMGWDAEWYGIIAQRGYPSELPRDESGLVTTNAWAFMPLYPLLAKILGAPFGQYAVGAILVALAAGYGACLVLFHLLRGRLGENASSWAVLMFAAGPLAAMFQVGYAESLFLLWLFLALWAVQRRRFAWLYLFIPLMGYTRPGVLPFALMLACYGIWRWLHRRTDPLPARDVLHIIAAGLLGVVVGFSWPFIVGAVTGEPSAYFETELAWRRSWTGDAEGGFVPFSGFLEAAAIWFRLWGFAQWWGYVFLVVGVASVAALLLWEPHVRKVGPEIRLWSASYLLYLLAVFFPQSSVFRLLLPLSPLYGALAAPRSTLWRVSVLILGLAGQWWWIYNMYALANTYFQIP